MSEMQAIKAILTPLSLQEVDALRVELAGSEQGVWEFLEERDIVWRQGRYFHKTVHYLDEHGFILTEFADCGEIHVTALFYNGATCTGEILGDAIGKAVTHGHC